MREIARANHLNKGMGRGEVGGLGVVRAEEELRAKGAFDRLCSWLIV